jgi:carbonic anhydrase
MDLIYRYDPYQPISQKPIEDAAAADKALRDGNDRFAEIARRMQQRTLGAKETEPIVIPVSPISLGLPLYPGAALAQSPFALVLGCSDARVPIEPIFDQSFNDLFVVRIAGNVLGTECLGSIDYAVRHLGNSLKLVVVLGHSGCGAVTAAVDGYLSPNDFVDIAFTHALRSLVDRIQIAVRAAAKALRQTGGASVERSPDYRERLIEMAVYLNAAVTAFDLQREIRSLDNSTLKIVYGVYEMTTLHVRSLPDDRRRVPTFECGFADAPETADDFMNLGQELAERLLGAGDPGVSAEW